MQNRGLYIYRIEPLSAYNSIVAANSAVISHRIWDIVCLIMQRRLKNENLILKKGILIKYRCI